MNDEFKYGDIVARLWTRDWMLTPKKFVVTSFVDDQYCSFSTIAKDGTLHHYPGSNLHVRDDNWIKIGEWDFENNKEKDDD